MNAGELLDQLNHAGATVEIVDGKPRVRGAKIGAELLEALKANRDAVLAEMERRALQDRDRYGRVPPLAALKMGGDVEMPAREQKLFIDYALRQARVVHAWVNLRSVMYFSDGKELPDCDWRACVDLVAWQRQCSAQEALEFLTGLDDHAENRSQVICPVNVEKAKKKG